MGILRSFTFFQLLLFAVSCIICEVIGQSSDKPVQMQYWETPYEYTDNKTGRTEVITAAPLPNSPYLTLKNANCPKYNADETGVLCTGANTAYSVKKNTWQQCANECKYGPFTIFGSCAHYSFNAFSKTCYIKGNIYGCLENADDYVWQPVEGTLIGECATSCEVSEWSAWTPCKKDCDGYRSRYRTLLELPSHADEQCPHLYEYANCNLSHNCPPMCPQYGIAILGWGCQLSGLISHSPNVKKYYMMNWQDCLSKCKSNPFCSAWSYNATSVSHFDSVNVFRPCYVSEYSQGCQAAASGWISGWPGTMDTDCKYGSCTYQEWSPWTTCANICSSEEEQIRVRYPVSDLDQFNGNCPQQSEKRACASSGEALEQCKECLVSAWTEWGPCSSTCEGMRIRTRDIIRESVYPEVTCPAVEEIGLCNDEIPCESLNCVVGEWSDWSGCSMPCGGGVMERIRKVDGKDCPVANQTISCNSHECDGNNATIHDKCELCMSVWSSWSNCDALCGIGNRSRNRTLDLTDDSIIWEIFNISKPTDEARKALEELCKNNKILESTVCVGDELCDNNCVVGEWGEWSICSCLGVSERERSVKKPNDAAICPENINNRTCTIPTSCSRTPEDNMGLTIALAVVGPLLFLLGALGYSFASRSSSTSVGDSEYQNLDDFDDSMELDDEYVQEVGPESETWQANNR